jgi:RNA polymerase sigma factor (sigma-70 family)
LNQVTAIKQSDVKAFEEVYEQFHHKLYHYFLKRAGLEETAKELTQQAFIKLWSCRDTLSDQYSIDAVCFTIATSVLIDFFRKQALETRRIKALQLHEYTREPAIYADRDFESADYLQAVAGNLPAVRRHVFMLKIIKGYSNKEIAEQLSISVKTVEDHYSKALRQIRSISLSLPASLITLLLQY